MKSFLGILEIVAFLLGILTAITRDYDLAIFNMTFAIYANLCKNEIKE